MRGMMAGMAMMLAGAHGAWAADALPVVNAGPAAVSGLAAGWQRIDAHTLRRVDIATAASVWQRVDAHRWQMTGPGEARRAVAAR